MVFVAVSSLPNLFGMQARSIFWWGRSHTSVATPVSVESKDWKKGYWRLSKRSSSPTKLFGPWYFLVLNSSLCSFWIIFMCREDSGRLYCWFGAFLELALWPSLSLSFGSWVHFSVFKGTVWYFQNIARVSPRQKQQWTLRLRRPRPSPTHRWVFFAKYRALLAHGNILGSAKTRFSKRKFLDNQMYQSY